MNDRVERLHSALGDALRQHRTQPFTAPVTVAEIYQDLVPYRAVRSAVGFEMNADYEHALLQLLAGVGGYARIEPERAGTELREELTSPNPNVGLFRKFAACEVWVSEPPPAPEADPEESEPMAAAEAVQPLHYPAPSLWRPETADTSDEEDVRSAVAETSAEAPAAGIRQPKPPARPRGIAPPVGQPESRPDFDPRCGFCDSSLPGGRIVRFCPHCGADQALRPCASCGEPLDASWGFCVACGATQVE